MFPLHWYGDVCSSLGQQLCFLLEEEEQVKEEDLTVRRKAGEDLRMGGEGDVEGEDPSVYGKEGKEGVNLRKVEANDC